MSVVVFVDTLVQIHVSMQDENNASYKMKLAASWAARDTADGGSSGNARVVCINVLLFSAQMIGSTPWYLFTINVSRNIKGVR